MTTPTKQYQNVSYKELITYSENNPNRNRRLDSIEILPVKSIQDTSLDKLGLKGYRACTLNPSGILSLLVCINDPTYYSLSAKNARTHEIIELTTKLQEETENLKHSEIARKRRKIHDLIGAVYNGASMEEKDYLDLFYGISHMRNIHFILMKEAIQETIEEGAEKAESSLKGEIVFSSDPANWKRDNPVWIADYRARWVAIPSENGSSDIHKILINWFSTIEQLGWAIQWPEINGTKTELVEQLSQLPTWSPNDKKLTKDILSARLGRIKAMSVFKNWSTLNDDYMI